MKVIQLATWRGRPTVLCDDGTILCEKFDEEKLLWTGKWERFTAPIIEAKVDEGSYPEQVAKGLFG